MRTTAKIGPSGNSRSFYEADKNFQSTKAPKLLHELGLSAYEYSFGLGINIGEKKAAELGEECKKYDIALSVHAPYYINFANDEMLEKSINYLLRSAKMCKLMSGERVVFHVGSVGKLGKESAFEKAYKNLSICAEALQASEYADMQFCPETMGKLSQIGDTAEIAKLCKISDIFVPALDFGHINARTLGHLDNLEKFVAEFEIVKAILGSEWAQSIHIHYSKVEFGKSGEIRHLDNTDDKFGPDYRLLLQAIVRLKLTPTIICESASRQAEDALELYNYYNQLK